MDAQPHPANDPELVIVRLGSKVCDGLAEAVVLTRKDLDLYRTGLPRFVAEHHERGLANWIHDRLWANATALLDHLPDVGFHEDGPTREMSVSGASTIRIKRHDVAGRIATYATPTATGFFNQPHQLQLFTGEPGVHLAAGYVWLRDSREIGPTVLSARDGVNNLLWMRELPEPREADGAVVELPPVPTAPRPAITANPETPSIRSPLEA